MPTHLFLPASLDSAIHGCDHCTFICNEIPLQPKQHVSWHLPTSEEFDQLFILKPKPSMKHYRYSTRIWKALFTWVAINQASVRISSKCFSESSLWNQRLTEPEWWERTESFPRYSWRPVEYFGNRTVLCALGARSSVPHQVLEETVGWKVEEWLNNRAKGWNNYAGDTTNESRSY